MKGSRQAQKEKKSVSRHSAQKYAVKILFFVDL
jgi:hypothetical protein